MYQTRHIYQPEQSVCLYEEGMRHPFVTYVAKLVLVRTSVHISMLKPQEVVYWWFDAQQCTSRNVFFVFEFFKVFLRKKHS